MGNGDKVPYTLIFYFEYDGVLSGNPAKETPFCFGENDITLDLSEYKASRVRVDFGESPCFIILQGVSLNGQALDIDQIENNSTKKIAGILKFSHNNPFILLNAKQNIGILNIKFHYTSTITEAVFDEAADYIAVLKTRHANMVAEKDDALEKLKAEYTGLLSKKDTALKNLQADAWHYQNLYNQVVNATFWKIAGPALKICDRLRKIRWLVRLVKFILRRSTPTVKIDTSYAISRKIRTEQENTSFENDTKFSIITPLYNTGKKMLVEMLESVKNQTYKNWQHCIVDASDAAHLYVGKTVKTFSEKDKRITYKKLEKNGGISVNSNAAIELATGDYIAILDHDDLLHPSALFYTAKKIDETGAEFIYSDECTFFSPNIKNISSVANKPDFAPDTMRGTNYLCHFSAFKCSLLEKTPAFRSKYDGSQDHDLFLRLTHAANKVEHIRKILYFWRAHPGSTALASDSKSYAVKNGCQAVMDFCRDYLQLNVTAVSSYIHPGFYRVSYQITGNPLVSIIILNKDAAGTLKTCIGSILQKSTYRNYEIIIVENNSTETQTFEYYKKLEASEKNIKVLYYPEKGFNFSKLNNYAVKTAKGEYYLLLNNDTEVITPGWIEELLMHVQRAEIGAAGAMLYYFDNTVQHAGVGIGIDGVAEHLNHRLPRGAPGSPLARCSYSGNVSAVTGACMMIKAGIYHELGGLDEDLPVAFNDIDLCLRIRYAGYLIVWTPFCELYHFESKTRGWENTPEKQKRFQSEIAFFQKRHIRILRDGDPYR